MNKTKKEEAEEKEKGNECGGSKRKKRNEKVIR